MRAKRTTDGQICHSLRTHSESAGTRAVIFVTANAEVRGCANTELSNGERKDG